MLAGVERGEEKEMIYDIKSMRINGITIKAENGYVFRATEHVIYWMGTPPSEDDLKPREIMRINWRAVLIPVMAHIVAGEDFRFEIISVEGHKFIGTAFFTEHIRVGLANNYYFTDSLPTVSFFEEVLIDG